MAYYCKSQGLTEGVYLVFIASGYEYPDTIQESTEEIDGVLIRTYLVWYDEEKDF